MIKHYVKQHGKYHLALFCVMALGVTIAYYTREQKSVEMIVLVSMTFLYILFGIIHHKMMHNLSSKIVIEYIAMGSLGLTIALFVLKGFAL